MTVLECLRNGIAEFGAIKLDDDLSSNILDLLMTPVIPAPLFANCLQIMGDRTPGLLASL